MIRSKTLALAGAALAVALIVAGALLLRGTTDDGEATVAMSGPAVTVYKSPACECCGRWVSHLREHGFQVQVEEMEHLGPVKARYGVTNELASCHTAVVDDYVVEGHVPADVILRLLEERPQIAGLSVPGMPVGSPGMEIPGRVPQPYDVVAFDEAGDTRVYASR